MKEHLRRIVVVRWLFSLVAIFLVGCSAADNKPETAAGNVEAVNHTTHGINWMEINGYRAHAGGGSSCCIVMPVKWRPGLKAHIEWEVDPNPFEKIKRKPTGFEFDDTAWAEHAKKFQRFSETVDIPEWPGTEIL